MTNPLLQSSVLPKFNEIKAEHVVPAIQALIDEAETELQRRLDAGEPYTWESIVAPIEDIQDKINQAWSPVCHLNSVMNTDELRKAYEEAEQKLTAFYTAFGQNRALFEAYEALIASDGFEKLNTAQQQTLKHAVRDFKLSGVALTGEDKEAFKNIKAQLSSLTTQFSNNVLDATNGWFHHVKNEDALAGLPDFLIQGAKQAAQERELEGYVLTLDLPVFFTVISQSENGELRRVMYEAYNTRASQEGPNAGKWDNTELIDNIMKLRQQMAELLGFNNYAEVSLASKMAESPAQVVSFLEDLATKTKSFAEKELVELQSFAKEQHSIDNINAWDVPYVAEQLKLAKYNVSQEVLRPYFPLDVVKAGLFQVASSLFNIDVQKAEAEVWHEDADYYEILRDGKAIASFTSTYMPVQEREAVPGWPIAVLVALKVEAYSYRLHFSSVILIVPLKVSHRC